jgi:hypothetical protein
MVKIEKGTTAVPLLTASDATTAQAASYQYKWLIIHG